MEIVDAYPPNYDDIVAKFKIKSRSVVFTYGDTIYAPGAGALADHLIAHESVHSGQQHKLGVEAWWRLYLIDAEFRLEQEVEAYRAQYRVLLGYPRAQRREGLNHLAKDLASPIYGNVISSKRAKELITEGI